MKLKFLKDYEKAKVGDIAEVEDVMGAGLVSMKIAEPFETKIVAEVDSKALGLSIAEVLREQMKRTEVTKVVSTPAKKMFANVMLDVKNGAKLEQKDSNINVTTAADGQYEISVDSLVGDVDLMMASGAAQLARRVVTSGRSNNLTWNTMTSAGNAPALIAEDAAMSAFSQPVVTQVAMTLKKLIYMWTASEESLEDLVLLNQQVNSNVSNEFSKYVEKYMIFGAGDTGATYGFESIVGCTRSTVSVAKDSGQTAATISIRNLNNMFMAQKNPTKSTWLVSRSAFAYLSALTTGSGGVPVYMPNGNVSGRGYGTILGQSVVICDHGCQAVGAVGDIIFADMSSYLIAQKFGLSVASTDALYWLNDQTAFKARYRICGRPIGAVQTADDGTVIGDFVTLAIRA